MSNYIELAQARLGTSKIKQVEKNYGGLTRVNAPDLTLPSFWHDTDLCNYVKYLYLHYTLTEILENIWYINV